MVQELWVLLNVSDHFRILFLTTLTFLHLTYVFWMHPLVLNQQYVTQKPAVKYNEGTRRSRQIEGSYVAVMI